MVVGRVTEYPVAVWVGLLWKVVFTGDVSIFTKAGIVVDAVKVDAGPRSVPTSKLDPGKCQARNKAPHFSISTTANAQLILSKENYIRQ